MQIQIDLVLSFFFYHTRQEVRFSCTKHLSGMPIIRRHIRCFTVLIFFPLYIIATQNYFARRGAANSPEMWGLLFLVPLSFLWAWNVQTDHQKQMFKTFTRSQKKSDTAQGQVLNIYILLESFPGYEVTGIIDCSVPSSIKIYWSIEFYRSIIKS